MKSNRLPSPLLSFLPILVLLIVLMIMMYIYNIDAVGGAGQCALLVGSITSLIISLGIYKHSIKYLEKGFIRNAKLILPTIPILLLIGAISATWMLSGVVPTLIVYGLKIIQPEIFLVSTCATCAIVSIIIGSSWTTIATIGVAFMGIGTSLGFSDGWIAGAIISGAYFGDKVSPLSDTTVLASSTVGTPLFTHIRYMMITTIPSLIVALIVFAVVGIYVNTPEITNSATMSAKLSSTFIVSPWLMIIPVLTCVLISFRMGTLTTLSISALLAAVCIPFQAGVMEQLANADIYSKLWSIIKIIATSTQIETNDNVVNSLVATRGMYGMFNTIYLIICAMIFSGIMSATGMLKSMTTVFTRFIKTPKHAVTSTVFTGIFFNAATADQYLSILLTSNLYRTIFSKKGLETRLLSRSVEDGASVTSVLVPWNSCGIAQSTVLGVSTLTYIPYCIFNIISPIMSVIIVSIGFHIKTITDNSITKIESHQSQN